MLKLIHLELSSSISKSSCFELRSILYNFSSVLAYSSYSFSSLKRASSQSFKHVKTSSISFESFVFFPPSIFDAIEKIDCDDAINIGEVSKSHSILYRTEKVDS